MRTEFKKIVFMTTLILFATLISTSYVSAEVTKWEQPPDRTPNGMDMRFSKKGTSFRMLADDFNCTTTGPITKVKLWGSWKGDIKASINRIHLAIRSDVPIGPNNPSFSKPGQVLWSSDFDSTHYTETLDTNLAPYYEWWWDPNSSPIQNGDQKIWMYEISIDPCSAFTQQGTPANPIIYWLNVYADINTIPAASQFGWKTSTMHWNDDAVRSIHSNGPPWYELRYPPQHPYYSLPRDQNSIDLAFAIITGTTEPNVEPNYPNAKWLQPPDLSENGVDVMASENPTLDNLILADDFDCNKTTKITDITIWGSWKDDYLPYGNPNDVSFTLSIHSDGHNPVGYSQPNDVLWYKTLMPSEVSIQKSQINEWWYNPHYVNYYFPGDHVCWKYVFHIPEANAFCQKGTPTHPVVYWLDVQAHPFDTTAQFGWKSSTKHWNDGSVITVGSEPYWGIWDRLVYPTGHPWYPQPIDLAFAIDGNKPCEPEDPNLKYLQPPDLTETGVDARFDRSDSIIRTLADDFPCTSKGRITGVKLWGSWLNDFKGNVRQIHLSIHTDIPASQSPTGYSMPGPLLWQRDIAPKDFNEYLQADILPYYESWWDPYTNFFQTLGDHKVWRYEIRIPWDYAFEQQGDPNYPKVYWLDAWAILDPNIPTSQFGWKSSRTHWNDDAVWNDGTNWLEMRYPQGHPYYPQSMDLAFEIRTQKECMKTTACGYPPGPIGQGYINWIAGGKPGCWCYIWQQWGDVDGKEQGAGITLKRIGSVDLSLFAPCYNKKRALINGTACMCADLDHLDQGAGITLKAIGNVDLAILSANFNKKTVALPNPPPYAGDYNYWITPP
jgi:hypothetical protein